MFPFHEDCFVLFENDGDANGMEETERFDVPSDRVPPRTDSLALPFCFLK